jgi:hypothetical protein
MSKFLKTVGRAALITAVIGGGLVVICASFLLFVILEPFAYNSKIYKAGITVFVIACTGFYLRVCSYVIEESRNQLDSNQNNILNKSIKTPPIISKLLFRLKSWLVKVIKNSKIYRFSVELKGLPPKQTLNRLAAAAFNLVRPPKVFITAPILILIALAIVLIPPFIFNEMEYQFRAQFTASKYLARTADEIVEFRRTNGNNVIYENSPYSCEEYLQTSDDIENLIEESLDYLDAALITSNRQHKIPFLGSKYKTYLNKKEKSIKNYRGTQEYYLSMKKKQHMSTNTIFRIFQLQKLQRQAAEGSINWNEFFKKIPELSNCIHADTERLYEQDYITEGLYQYLDKINQSFVVLYAAAISTAKKDSWGNFNIDEYVSLLNAAGELGPALTESSKIAEQKKAAYNQMFHESDELMYEASDYYNENQLAFDKISVLLSRFSSYFPRNYYEEGMKIFVPTDVNQELVGIAGF